MTHGTDLHTGQYVVTTYPYGMLVIATSDHKYDVALFDSQADRFRFDLETAYERHMPTVAFPTVSALIDAMCDDYVEVMEAVPAD